MGIRDLRVMVDGHKHDEFFNELERGEPVVHRDNSIVLPNVSTDHSRNGNAASLWSTTLDANSSLDSEFFSDIDLSYISRMLMEEDIDEKLDMFRGHPALKATEKPFYDILGEFYTPPSPDQLPLNGNQISESFDCSIYLNSNDGSSSSGIPDNSWDFDTIEFSLPHDYPVSTGYSSQSSFNSTNSINIVSEGLEEPLLSKDAAPIAESLTAWKYPPGDDKLVIDLEANGFLLPQEPEEEREYSIYGSRGRKNPHSDDLCFEEGRSSKHSALYYTEETLRSEMSDMVSFCHVDECRQDAAIQNAATKSSQNSNSKGLGGGKARGKKQSKNEMIDLTTLLINCSQSVAIDDHRSANEQLKQIRQHSSPFGDGMQRLAHCFADGLEARLAGTGSEKYRSHVAQRMTAADILKAYQLYMAACPFKKVSHFFSNQTILDVTENAPRVHIIDFGIYFGFHWPSFIQRLSSRPGGPPNLRITGVDIPQPGFHPAEQIEETGRRLAEYARSFGVPFEYHAIAAKWETIGVADLRIEKDEMLIVNCLYRISNVEDEIMVVDSPRDVVLNTIRKLNPAAFIQGVVNGLYGVPFFVTRFREALFHFSALFDMLETNSPREDAQRLLIERDLFGRQALNVIACEGSERVERPETYKKWQVRNRRAGFVQLPLDPDIMKKARDKVKGCYHKDFVIDEDGRWLLQGWKGRVVYALSTWKPR